MPRKTVQVKSRDRSVALRAANTFLQYSKQFTDPLPEDSKQAANVAVRDIGGMIGSATTLLP